MPYSQADLDALDAEIAATRAAKATQSGDQSTTFRDLDEILALRSVMAAAIATAAGTSRTRYVTTCKGL